MLCVNRLFQSFLFVSTFLAIGLSSAHAQIDLHAHLDMKPGMGLFLQGSWKEEPKAENWSNKIFTRVSEVSLSAMTNETRPKLMVISFYGHPYFGYSFSRDGFHFDRKNNVRKSVEQEYQDLIQFISQHSDHFAIAKNAPEARSILKSSKTVIVLSLEGAWATLDSPEDKKLWIDDRGLAIVTPVHLTPDSLGGNALMQTIVSFANATEDFIKSVWTSRGSCLKSFCKSPSGFSVEGLQTIQDLMKKNVWLDFSHANELEVQTIIEKYETGSKDSTALPLLVTHTQLREFFPTERGLGTLEINYIRKHDGIVGIIPTQYMMPEAMKAANEESLKNNPEEAKATSAGKGLSCISGLDVFRKTVSYAIATLGAPERVSLGSDINAPLDGLSPGCGDPVTKNGSALDTAQFDLHRKGFYTYSQWNALTRFASPDVLNSPTPWADLALEHFLTLWEKVRP